MYLLCYIFLFLPISQAILYPYDTPSRETKSLDGIWRFKPDPASTGIDEAWYSKPLDGDDLIEMVVPSSYNDITTSVSLRDMIGLVWYERNVILPAFWSQDKRVMIRFGSVHYKADVWVDGVWIGSHEGGHMAFEFDISEALDSSSGPYRMTVAVNNTLTPDTVPQGRVVHHDQYVGMETEFDFFNYAGIHRPVVLYTTSNYLFIKDIDVKHYFQSRWLDEVLIEWNVTYEAHVEPYRCNVEVVYGSERIGEAACSYGKGVDSGGILLHNPMLWWPRGMGQPVGQMYEIKFTIEDEETGMIRDVYSLPYGLRKVEWDSDSLKINNQPFYIHGIARHEDSVIRGKGLDLPTMMRDHHLLEWMGANGYRTSHYPYAEEDLQMSDRQGIIVISECAAVSLDGFSDGLLKNHLAAITELYHRDANHPSVIMWSVANEPRSFHPEAGPYFKAVTDQLRSLDSTRPLTVIMYDHGEDLTEYAVPYVDIIGVNKYVGWYTDSGHLEVVASQLKQSLLQWRETFGKPLMLTEYGGDTIAGLHSLPGIMFTEEFQADMLRSYWAVFDELRVEGWFVGEMPWVFTDFMTKQEIRRVVGNKKGIFTRDRQPKMAAHLLRERYLSMDMDMGKHDEL